MGSDPNGTLFNFSSQLFLDVNFELEFVKL